LVEEVRGSRDDLARALDTEVLAFAYPYGFRDEAVMRVAAEHFEVAYSAAEGRNSRSTNRWDLRRTMVQPNDVQLDLVARLSLGYAPVHRARVRLGALRGRLGSARSRSAQATTSS
jgi:hypothetical protein